MGKVLNDLVSLSTNCPENQGAQGLATKKYFGKAVKPRETRKGKLICQFIASLLLKSQIPCQQGTAWRGHREMLLWYTRYMEHHGRETSLRNSALKTITKHGFVNHAFTAMGGKKNNFGVKKENTVIRNMKIITFQCLNQSPKAFNSAS